MCYPVGDFQVSEADVLLGQFNIAAPEEPGGDADREPQLLTFWMSKEQFTYWSHTHLTVDVVAGRGSGFSVESPEGKRFLIRSSLMDWPA